MYENSKRKFKQRRIKVVPLALVLLLLFSLISQASVGTALPSDSQRAISQVVDAGGSYYYEADGKQADASNYDVRVSKTVTQAAQENHFKVDLEVETPSAYKEVKQADSAVVLVLDVSGSMSGECTSCGETADKAIHKGDVNTYYCTKDDKLSDIVDAGFYMDCNTCGESVNTTNHYIKITKRHDFIPRIVSAKAALKKFLKDYMENAGTYKRYFSIVTYSTTSDVFLGWTDTSKSD